MVTHPAIYAMTKHLVAEYFGLEFLAIVSIFGLFHLCLVVFCGPKRRKRGATP